jgi:preprotein translocase subunit YajC
MDILIPFLTNTETPFFLLFVTLFVYFIRDAQKRDKTCNKQLEVMQKKQDAIYKILIKELERKRKGVEPDDYK